MTDDLRRKLQFLEDGYFGQPVVAQQGDLREINRIRAQIGMPAVDASLKEIAAPVVEKDAAPKLPDPADLPQVGAEHAQGREVYEAYLSKMKMLELHRAYARQIGEATDSRGQTPVRPLATMGTGGGPLLCDQCGKAIVLEGKPFHGMGADVAWKANPNRSDNWCSWISGGLVVEFLSNGTLRIYHGYPGRGGSKGSHCCDVAARERTKALQEFRPGAGYENRRLLDAFIARAFPAKTSDERTDLVQKILDTLYGYDPGIGVNRPAVPDPR